MNEIAKAAAVTVNAKPVITYAWVSANFKDRDVIRMAEFIGDDSYDNSEATRAHVVRVVKAALAAGWAPNA
jgi:hypothetical protein